MKKILLGLSIILATLSVKGQFNNELRVNDYTINKEYIYNNSYLQDGSKFYEFRKQSRKNKILSLALNTTSIAFEAIGDGLLDGGRAESNQNKMVLGHSFQAASVACLLAQPVFMDLDTREWLNNAASYVFLRFAVFDPIYNKTRGLPYYYIGTTSLTDRTLTAINNPPRSYTFLRGLSLLVGVSIPLNEF